MNRAQAHGLAALEAPAAQLPPPDAPHILELFNFNIDTFGKPELNLYIVGGGQFS